MHALLPFCSLLIYATRGFSEESASSTLGCGFSDRIWALVICSKMKFIFHKLHSNLNNSNFEFRVQFDLARYTKINIQIISKFLCKCLYYESILINFKATNYYSDKSLSEFVSIFWKHNSEYWKQNKNLMLFYQSLQEKHLKLKVMPRLNNLICMNVQIFKFVQNIKWNNEDYDRQAIEGLMLNSFRYAKHIYADQIINEAYCIHFYEMQKKNFKYYERFNLNSWLLEYNTKHSNLLEALKSNEADLMKVMIKSMILWLNY